MVTLAAAGAGETAGDAFDQGILVDIHDDDMVESHFLARKELFERVRLRRGARITIEDEAPGDIRFGQPIGQNARDDLIGHKTASIHHCFCLEANLGFGGLGSAKHVSGGELDHSPIRFEPLCLGPLARPRGSKQYDVHLSLPPFSRAFLIRSPY